MQFLQKTQFDFIGKRYLSFALSSLLILAGLVSLVLKRGPRLGIDFTGGTLIQLAFQEAIGLDQIREELRRRGSGNVEIQSFPKQKAFLIRSQGGAGSPEVVARTIPSALREAFPANPFQVERVEYVGPVVGQRLVRQAFWAVIWSLVGIVVYVGFRFRSSVWGVAGVVALLHDVFTTVGLFSLLNKELTITVVAALLTIAGYSINDTIVIFDRMREKLRTLRKVSLGELINLSVNETLSRTVNTSLTVFLVLLALFFWGGEVIHDFSLALLYGVVVGSYSTIFVASPLVYEWQTWKARRAQRTP
ncbi:MAG: protein translocase subunit SecF [Elusimicrobia bacterium]|nr:protein translocase subunit SecF [Elusimicrobiota bacterium]